MEPCWPAWGRELRLESPAIRTWSTPGPDVAWSARVCYHSIMPARRGKTAPLPREAVLLVPRADAAARIARQLEAGVRLRATPQPETHDRREELEAWTDHTIELLRYLFDNDVEARRFCATSRARSGPFRVDDYYWNSSEEFFDPLDARISALHRLRDRLEIIPEAPRADVSVARAGADDDARDNEDAPLAIPSPSDNGVVVVHGHDRVMRERVRQVLLTLGLSPVVLAAPITAPADLEQHAAGAEYAVVLLSPDDIGGPRRMPAEALRPRPRQDLLLELGFFCGHLGPGRVCGLHSGGIEIPSAFPGVTWIEIDEQGAWAVDLGDELKASGVVASGNEARRPAGSELVAASARALARLRPPDAR
jgi:predicted nucleotide-binding protein